MPASSPRSKPTRSFSSCPPQRWTRSKRTAFSSTAAAPPWRGSSAVSTRPRPRQTRCSPRSTAISARPRRRARPSKQLLRRLAANTCVGQHAEGAFVDVEEALHLVELVLVHFADPDDLAHDLGLEAGALGLGV